MFGGVYCRLVAVESQMQIDCGYAWAVERNGVDINLDLAIIVQTLRR